MLINYAKKSINLTLKTPSKLTLLIAQCGFITEHF